MPKSVHLLCTRDSAVLMVIVGNAKISPSFVYERFSSLAKTHFIHHSKSLADGKKEDKVDEEADDKQFVVPSLEGRANRNNSVSYLPIQAK